MKLSSECVAKLVDFTSRLIMKIGIGIPKMNFASPIKSVKTNTFNLTKQDFVAGLITDELILSSDCATSTLGSNTDGFLMMGRKFWVAVPRALTIAGSDCSGGAGLQADLKVFFRFGVFGQSAVTAVVAENTVGVQGVAAVRPDFVALQIDSCLSDVGADVVKTGMLVDSDIVQAVAERLRFHDVRRLVIDPVMCAKNGDRLIAVEAVHTLVNSLFPLATVVTPNVPEAEALWGRKIQSVMDFRTAAVAIRAMGPRVVVMKRGHSPVNPEGESVDYAFGDDWVPISTARQRPQYPRDRMYLLGRHRRLHGPGDDPVTAVRVAKQYITEAMPPPPTWATATAPSITGRS